MREYTKKPENQSRTLDSNPRASRQAPISEILQAYKNGNLGRQSIIQRESVEDEELLQTKRSGQTTANVILQRYKESIQRYAPEEEDLLQSKFDTTQREEIDEDKLLQGKFESTPTAEQELVQREEKPNNTGLPDNLKTGIENLSGYSMDDVKVHYNSDKPAQLQALAYTQGTDIHVALGQEKYLPHEAWHVVQQKQGRVRPTIQLEGMGVNDNEGLEKEADEMQTQILEMSHNDNNTNLILLQQTKTNMPSPLILKPSVQCKVGFEFETGIPVGTKDILGDGFTGLNYQEKVFTANSGLWKIVADSSNMEFVTEPFSENDAGRDSLIEVMTDITSWAAKIPPVVTNANTAGQPGRGRVDNVDPTIGTTHWSNFKNILIRSQTLTDTEILAAPQATGGVRLDQIPALIDNMTHTNIVANHPQAVGVDLQTIDGYTIDQINQAALTGKITNDMRDQYLDIKTKLETYRIRTAIAPQQFATSLVAMNIDHATWLVEAKDMAINAINHHVALLPVPAPDFSKLKGLLTLVISYLLIGDREPKVMKYSKIIAPLMARTNFYTMYRLLADWERTLFTENFVLNAAGLVGTGGTNIFNSGFYHNEGIEHGPTRGEWIDSIINGRTSSILEVRKPQDLMSQGSGSAAAENSSSLGSMTNPDRRVSGQQDLAVLELRRLPKKVHRTEWSQMALDIFNMIIGLP